MASPGNQENKKILIVLLFAGILIGGLIVFAGMTYLSSPGHGTSNTPAAVTPVKPVTTQPEDYLKTGSTNTVLPSLSSTPVPNTSLARTAVPAQNPTSSPVITGQTITPGLSATGSPVDSSDTVVPQPFTLSVSPSSTSGKPGDTISYTLRIDGGEGQTEPIHFTLTADALFFSQTYDLGDEQPPFPKTSVYQFTIPTNIPSGITINGVLTATGAGQTREQPVTLKVL
ncbi:MAG: hypothetical protein WCP36_04195 [Methanomicrobiales archaeon]